jgi:hypothetical protein
MNRDDIIRMAREAGGTDICGHDSMDKLEEYKNGSKNHE